MRRRRQATGRAIAAIALAALFAGVAAPRALGDPEPLYSIPVAPGFDPDGPGPAEPPPRGVRKYKRLSNERTRTLWAYVMRPVWVRSSASAEGRRLARLRLTTFSGSAEVVLVLARKIVDGRRWLRIRYPGLGRRVGWVRALAIGPRGRVGTRLVIDRERLTVRLYRRGHPVFRARAGVGAAGSPTPAGRYYVRERLLPASPGGIYGTLAFGLSAHSRFRTDWPGGGQVGLHGTNQPELIPGWISNGCIRLRNPAIRRLDRKMPVGTPVKIL